MRGGTGGVDKRETRKGKEIKKRWCESAGSKLSPPAVGLACAYKWPLQKRAPDLGCLFMGKGRKKTTS